MRGLLWVRSCAFIPSQTCTLMPLSISWAACLGMQVDAKGCTSGSLQTLNLSKKEKWVGRQG